MKRVSGLRPSDEPATKPAKDMTDAELRAAWSYYDAERLYSSPRWGELDAEYVCLSLCGAYAWRVSGLS